MTNKDVSPLIRAALMVRSLDRSIAFYKEVIGLEQRYYEGDLGGTSAAALMGVPDDAAIRAVILKVPGVDYGMLGLFEMPADTPAVSPRQGGLALGEAVLVFYTEDLDRAVNAALSLGGTIATPLQILNSRKEIAIRDPDGVAVNLIERPISDAWKERAPGDPIRWPPRSN